MNDFLIDVSLRNAAGLQTFVNLASAMQIWASAMRHSAGQCSSAMRHSAKQLSSAMPHSAEQFGNKFVCSSSAMWHSVGPFQRYET
jgi:hypothetical protein